MSADEALYLGFDLSTQQLKCIAVNSSLKLRHEAKVDFDADLQHYGTNKGVLSNAVENEVYAPTVMWAEALELVLKRLIDAGLKFGSVRGISGAGMQHGTVFWSYDADRILGSLDPTKPLATQLQPEVDEEEKGVFAHPFSPNWQDASTQKECDRFDAVLGGPDVLAKVTGSRAHHRFSGPQILRYREKFPEHYKRTARISLVSSYLASLLLGRIAPIDISDATGMSMWDIQNSCWHSDLLGLAAGDSSPATEIEAKLGSIHLDANRRLGTVSKYFVKRYGFASDADILPFTGDNPATILALPLRPNDAIVSLGTSTTFLMSTDQYVPDPAYHFMNHPTTHRLYMFMLCYKNGSLAREQIRDALNRTESGVSHSWQAFDRAVQSTPPLVQLTQTMRLGLYFPRPEIVPNVATGQWRFSYDPSTEKLTSSGIENVLEDARTIVESQMLSLRLRSQNLVRPVKDENTGEVLPPQPRRIYLVGGGSVNPAIAQICGEVLGSSDGVYRLDIGGNACALGSAYKAVWGCEGNAGESFEDFIGSRWDESKFVKRVANGYNERLFAQYGQAVKGFDLMEMLVQRESSAASRRRPED